MAGLAGGEGGEIVWWCVRGACPRLKACGGARGATLTTLPLRQGPWPTSKAHMEEGLKMARRVGSYTHRWAADREPSSLATCGRGGGREGGEAGTSDSFDRGQRRCMCR